MIEAAKKSEIIPLQVDMTHVNDSNKTLLINYGGTALPYAVLIDANGDVVAHFEGMFAASTLLQVILENSIPR